MAGALPGSHCHEPQLRNVASGESEMPHRLGYLAIPFLGFLAGCATPTICPPPEIVTITESVRIPVPGWLTATCQVSCPPLETNGDLLECWQATRRALAECDARMTEIRALE